MDDALRLRLNVIIALLVALLLVELSPLVENVLTTLVAVGALVAAALLIRDNLTTR
ncbi:hypothetical protein VB773_15255 [Haloarculaceae archaeon H-GB2-1]|nr:hypothetical protein [Haloarculaceae archaeon H-GB1-1]MEA5387320.1 hypothetical protein [Haloarculaceae archaeon H-GB11]MEA5408787.1 hypothetical protein [Haloarculaceae archaeon H-GB2-1]